MIRMIQSTSEGHAKAYFADALSKADYYISDQELPGRWQGRLALRLGLTGPVSKDHFFALAENKNPQTGKTLTPRNKSNRTTGYDINFHCPKSVSILHVLSGDDLILKAFDESVTETMGAIEQDIKTRIRKGGTYDDRKTGELAWAQFIHQTARPVEGHAPDPHLHAHCFVFNATWDDVEQKFKAGQFRDIKRDMPFYQAQFHKRLADKLMALGYDIRVTAKSFELEGVSKEVIDLFSKRTDEIGRIAKEKGITDAKALGELGARTRAKKQKGKSMMELQGEWKEQIKQATGKKDDAIKVQKTKNAKQNERLSPEECIDHALLHCFERASVMRDRRILESAIRYSLGKGAVSIEDIATRFEGDQRIIHVEEKSGTLCTTKEVLKEEKRMVELARLGQGKMVPLYREAPTLQLKGQQAEAVTHVLTTSHRVSIIKGAAGTGKTTLMREAIDKIKSAGKSVTILAPTAEASRGTLKQEGFEGADTVARFLLDRNMQQGIKNQVLWVDEAGLLGTKDMTALLDIATKNNARLILGGDTRQHASVVRGDALRILNTVAGIRSAEVSKIYRQKNEEYRAAVEDLSKGKISEGFEKLDRMGAIKTIDPLKPNEVLVKDYIAALKSSKTALVISPTHKQGEEVTTEIRKNLRSEGMIGKKEIKAVKLVNRNLTEAQKKDTRNFETGQIVQFNQNVPGFTRGSLWRVERANNKSVHVVSPPGEKKLLPLHKSKSFDLFIEEDILLSKGDKIRITRNGFDADKKRLNNGQALEVMKVSKAGKITLKNSTGDSTYTLDESFRHIAHAHVITSHAAQGKTVDEIFIAQPAATFPATDAKQFYVSVSRGRSAAHIYTDDRESLLAHASEAGDRTSALELVGNAEKTKEAVMQKIQEEFSARSGTNKTIAKTKTQIEYEPDFKI